MERERTPMDPGEIEKRSFEIIESEVPEPRPFNGREWLIVRRMIHTSADLDLLSLVRFHPDAVRHGMEALKKGCLIVTDTQMVRMGITRGRMERLGCEVACYINDPEVRDKAARGGRTRAALAVDRGISRFEGSLFVVGNAPTALLRILEILEDNGPTPALIVGMPVGFVSAKESKDLLMAQETVPYITVEGRKGGSALAATVVNQLAEMALEEQGKG
ncbi:MAG: precorrin-8X methylmutase [Deltaproteobacteria bacterium]|nr:precorrin-8X methylmutase [Deltaproteobacteria bacterium]